MYRGLPEVSHSGVTAGYRAFLARYPDQGLSVAVLCNAGNAEAPSLAREVAAIYLGGALLAPTAPSPVPIEAAVLGRWTGLYRNVRTGEPLRVAVKDGALQAERRGALVPLSDSLFTLGDGTVRVQFRGQDVGRSFEVIGADGDITRFAIAAEVKPTAAELARYAGTYVSDEAEVTYVVRVQNDSLVLARRPDVRMPLTPAYRDAFTAPGIPLFLFRRDATGRVTGLSLGLGRVRDLRFRRVTSDASAAGS